MKIGPQGFIADFPMLQVRQLLRAMGLGSLTEEFAEDHL
jgi:hypothetical protein